MTPEKSDVRRLDRRQRKSRAALQQALLKVIATKSFDVVTVDEIAEAADVTRATFYAHYQDKAALLREAYEQLFDELALRVKGLIPLEEPIYSGAAVAEVLRHAKEHADLYRATLSGAAGSEARAAFTAALQEIVTAALAELSRRFGTAPPVPVSFVSATFSGALSSTVEAWLNRRVRGSPAEVAGMFMRTQFEGVEWALGLGAGQLSFEPLRQ